MKPMIPLGKVKCLTEYSIHKVHATSRAADGFSRRENPTKHPEGDPLRQRPCGVRRAEAPSEWLVGHFALQNDRRTALGGARTLNSLVYLLGIILFVLIPMAYADTTAEGGGSDDDGTAAFDGDNAKEFDTWCETKPMSCPKWLENNYNGDYAKTYFEGKPEVDENNKALFQRYLEGGDSGDTYTDSNLENADNYLRSFGEGVTDEKDKTIAEKFCRSVYVGKTCEFDQAGKITYDGIELKIEFGDNNGEVKVPAAGKNVLFQGKPGSSITIFDSVDGGDFRINGEGSLIQDKIVYSVQQGDSEARFWFEEGMLSSVEGSNWKIQGKLFTDRASDYIMARPGMESSFEVSDDNDIHYATDIEFTFITEVKGKRYDVRGKGDYSYVKFDNEQGVQEVTETTLEEGDAYASDALSGTATRFENALNFELKIFFGVGEGSPVVEASQGNANAIGELRDYYGQNIAIFTGTETVLLGQGKVTQKNGENDIAVTGEHEQLYTRIEGQNVQLATTEELDYTGHLAIVNIDNQDLEYWSDSSTNNVKVKATQNDERKAPEQLTEVFFSTQPLNSIGQTKGDGTIASINDLDRVRITVAPDKVSYVTETTTWDAASGTFTVKTSEPPTDMKLDDWYGIDMASGAATPAEEGEETDKDEKAAEGGDEGTPDEDEATPSREELVKEWTTPIGDDGSAAIDYGLPDKIGLSDLYTDEYLYIKQPDGNYYEVELVDSKYYYTDTESDPDVYAAIWGGEEIYSGVTYSSGKASLNGEEVKVPDDPPTQEDRDRWKQLSLQTAATITAASATAPASR